MKRYLDHFLGVAFFAAAALMIAASPALSRDDRFEKVYFLEEGELAAMSEIVSAFVGAGISEVEDVRQLAYEELAWIALSSCLADGRVEASDGEVDARARELFGFDLGTHRSFVRDGVRVEHSARRWSVASPIAAPALCARVESLYRERDQSLYLMTGEIVDAATGEPAADFYARASRVGKGWTSWAIRSLLRAEKPAPQQ